MLFNSIEFVFFFLFVYLVYLSLNHKGQNRMLLLASYLFYATWNWKFLSLILCSTFIDFICGKKIYETKSIFHRKVFLCLSIVINLGFLGFFKYYNFFSESLLSLINLFGMSVNQNTLDIVLPVGISFYTFQTMSYTIDIYREKVKPEKNILDFALYVAFFPQLVAGPIERASRLLPQIVRPRRITIKHITDGLLLILLGYFLKVFVADNLAMVVDKSFSSSNYLSGSEYLVAVYAFTFQIFSDFAGYSAIAIGIAQLMGIQLMTNFRYPYFVSNPREFWKHWHISLSTWLRDYLYIPLGGSRGSHVKTYRNLMITMLLGGLWHGAAWTFVLWGFYHGMILAIYRIYSKIGSFYERVRIENKVFCLLQIIIMFHITCFGWFIFRAQSIDQVWKIIDQSVRHFYHPEGMGIERFIEVSIYILPVLSIQLFQKIKNHELFEMTMPSTIRFTVIAIMLIMILLLGQFNSTAFIYFQF